MSDNFLENIEKNLEQDKALLDIMKQFKKSMFQRMYECNDIIYKLEYDITAAEKFLKDSEKFSK